MNSIRTWMFIAVGLLSVNCATSKKQEGAQVPGSDVPGQVAAPIPGSRGTENPNPDSLSRPEVPPPPQSSCSMRSVYFGFNQALLSDETRKALQENADCLRARGFPQVTIEGNCDERGTSEFNLILGLRRAERVRQYLVDLGVPARSIGVKTLGKEQLVCTESNEACWSRCRRADVAR